MANAKLHLLLATGVISKTYIIQGLQNRQDRKTQRSINLPFPLKSDENTIINSIFGQERSFNFAFIILDRTDDYTDGTGSPSTYSAEEQRVYLYDTIFHPRGYHILEDTYGNQFIGRIEDLQIVEAGDDPVKLDAVSTFKRGLVPII